MTKKESKEKLRVYEYAKSLNMSSKEIITILKRQGISVNNHMSVMEPEMIESVEQFFRTVKANAALKHQESAAAAAVTSGSASGETVQTQDRANEQGKRKDNRPRPQEAKSGQPEGRSGQQENKSGHQDAKSGQPSAMANQPASQPKGKDQGPGTKNQQDKQQPKPNGNGNRKQETQQARPGSNQQGQHPAKGDKMKTATSGETKNQQSPARGVSNRIPSLVLDDEYHDDDTPRTPAKVTKKTKPNQKRFDDNKVSSVKGPVINKGGKARGKGKAQPVQAKKEVDNTPKKIIVRGTMTVGELAKLMHKDVSEVIKKLLFLGVMATINQELDLDTIQLLADDFGIEVELKIPVDETNLEAIEEHDDPADLVERPPVVTIMGHVDHGKTTLLDAIRHTNVTAAEAGGITQHIGAYQVEINGKKITFLDTPGHEAFTSMRARGAQVTDITVLVVAADDGVMPQTVEAISHAKAANVPIIVAVNKIDKPTAEPERIKQELTEYGLIPEEWGGDTIFVNISAKQRQGLEQLLEMILLVAEVQELKANPKKKARGTVIEAELDKGKGPIARVLIQSGTLTVGDPFVAGVCFGRVRAMVNDRGKRIKEAGPSTPVEITGLSDVPQAGDLFFAFDDERKAREIAEKRAIKQRQAEMVAKTRVTLDDLFKQIKEGEIRELNVIIKADVQGSVEALRSALEKIDVEGVRVKIIHQGVGAITESDINLASASNAIIIGFNVRPEPAAKATAEQEKVDIRLHRIIYNVIEEIESAMKGLLDPVYKESVIGQAEIRNLFKVSKVGTIAGCMVLSGKITRTAEARVIRDGVVVYEGKIDSLKRFKDDVREVQAGYECGLTLERFNDLKEGDIIEAFVMETVER